MMEPLPKLPPGFEPAVPPAPPWWKEVYGPTEEGDPIEAKWLDKEDSV